MQFKTLIHAMVEGENEIRTPLCVWNQKKENAAERVKVEAETHTNLEEPTKGGRSMCEKSRQQAPASLLVRRSRRGRAEEVVQEQCYPMNP